MIKLFQTLTQSIRKCIEVFRELTPAQPPRQTIRQEYGQYLNRENAKLRTQAEQARLQQIYNRMCADYMNVALIVVEVMQTVAQSVRIVPPTHKYAGNPYNADWQLISRIHMSTPVIYQDGIFCYCFHGRKYADCDLSATDLCKELQIEIDKATNWHGLPRLICRVDYNVQNPRHYLLRVAWRSDLMAERTRRKRLASSNV